ncbi:poly(ADP-ribose) glycohydrolase-like isoform X2 [Ceratina calcarata]|uniref:poly(ADP-ribose) glycohydrolase n=1 Tax=Ceratina calcarata TaxID=156304 RepID=A0AAJ7RXG5_9HYME|nr:poly(ADP-ribose) glycohydrolase-like isoform X2 [Ceratina calcarata]
MYECHAQSINGSRRCQNRWEIIQQALIQNFVSTHQLEAAILSYNHLYAQRWDFSTLHIFFSEVLDEEETRSFFDTLLPKMVQLALQLPVLVTGPVPLLKRHTNRTISLSQLQIASLLANAFFCTFPRRNSTNPQSEYGRYPHINFQKLYSQCRGRNSNKRGSLMEKIKCILHYFRRVTCKAPEGVVTIQRRYIPISNCPKWEEQVQTLLPLHITSRGTIENGKGLLQVDFANKFVGGGVLSRGCVQEEIRFVICPELLVTMLVAEELDDTEALIVCGVERYSECKGYSKTFQWVGNYDDETPRDSSGRRLTSVVAIDALRFTYPQTQFNISNIRRELNKAYVGFVGCERSCRTNLPAVATGNWGCGAFRGNAKLKSLLQLMAAAVAGRSIVYFTFGDTSLRDDVAEMYMHLVKHEISIATIFQSMVQYQEYVSNRNADFYRFLYNRIKKEPPAQYCHESSMKSCSTKPFRKKDSPNNKEKRSYVSKHQETEEEKIQSWLCGVDGDADNERKTEIRNEDAVGVSEMDSTRKGKEENSDSDNLEKKKKPSLWELLNDTGGAQVKTSQERRSALELFDTTLDRASHQADNCSQSIKEETCQSKSMDKQSTHESLQSSNEKRQSSTKKSEQTKISNFFHRIN